MTPQGIDTQEVRMASAARIEKVQDLKRTLNWLEWKKGGLILTFLIILAAIVVLVFMRLLPLWLGVSSGDSAGAALGMVMAGQYLYSEASFIVASGGLICVILTIWAAATHVEISQLRALIVTLEQ